MIGLKNDTLRRLIDRFRFLMLSYLLVGSVLLILLGTNLY